MDFHDVLPMPNKYGKNKGKKLNLPRDAKEFRRLADRIDKIRDNIKAIADGLEDGPLHTVPMKLGTFELHLQELEELGTKHRKDFEGQRDIEIGRLKREDAEKKSQRAG